MRFSLRNPFDWPVLSSNQSAKSLTAEFGAGSNGTGSATEIRGQLVLDSRGRVSLTAPQLVLEQGVWQTWVNDVADVLGVNVTRMHFQEGPQAASTLPPSASARDAALILRNRLVDAAAREWRVDPTHCHTDGSQVVHSPSGRRLSYAGLVASAARPPVRAARPLIRRDPFTETGTFQAASAF